MLTCVWSVSAEGTTEHLSMLTPMGILSPWIAPIVETRSVGSAWKMTTRLSPVMVQTATNCCAVIAKASLAPTTHSATAAWAVGAKVVLPTARCARALMLLTTRTDVSQLSCRTCEEKDGASFTICDGCYSAWCKDCVPDTIVYCTGEECTGANADGGNPSLEGCYSTFCEECAWDEDTPHCIDCQICDNTWCKACSPAKDGDRITCPKCPAGTTRAPESAD